MSDEANANAVVDLDDPQSWPTDTAGLAGLADGDAPAAKAEAPEKAAAAPGADDGRGAAGAGAAGTDTKVVEDLSGSKDADPEGVLTRDGKHVIPYEVLKSEREARKGLEAQTAALTAEVQQLKDAAAAQGTGALAGQEGKEKPAATGDQAQELPAEVKTKVDELRENFGDEFADSWVKQWRTDAKIAAFEAWQKGVEEERATAAENGTKAANATKAAQEQAIQEAIDAVPLLATWQNDTANPEWYQAATQMHDMLMKSHTEYRAMSWEQRMAALPGHVEQTYGESPHSAKHRGTKDSTKTAADAIANATLRRPVSMSDIPGGEPPAASEAERLEAMTPAQLQAHINNIAGAGPEKLEKFLRTVS